MQSLKDDEYDYNEVNNLLNRYLNKYGISYTESGVIDDQSAAPPSEVVATPLGSAFRPGQVVNTKVSDVTVLHETQKSGHGGSTSSGHAIADNLAESMLSDIDLQARVYPSLRDTPTTGDTKHSTRTGYEQSISTLNRDIDTLEKRLFTGLHAGSPREPPVPDVKTDNAINLDDLEDALTMSDNINESLGQYAQARARLQTNVKNYDWHTSSDRILGNNSNNRDIPGVRRDVAKLYQSQSRVKRPLPRTAHQSRHRLTSSFPDTSTSLKVSRPTSKASWHSQSLVSKSDFTPRSRSQRSRDTIASSLLDSSLNADPQLRGIDKEVDTNEVISRVVINGQLTSIETRTILGRMHTLELILDQAQHTIRELKRENSRLQRVITSRDASTQKIMVLETEVLALQKALKQSEDARKRQTNLIDKLAADAKL